MDIYDENDNQKEKEQKKNITYHSTLIPMLENCLNEKPIKELKILSQVLIKFNEYKEEIATTILNPIKLKEIQQTFNFKIKSKLESLVVDALNMRIIENRNERIKKIYDWYTDRIDHFIQLREMKERTTPNLDQIEDEEPIIEHHYMTLKEINEHRTDIKGYENASKRIKNFKRKKIDNKYTNQINFGFKDGINLNYYYKENGFNNTLSTFRENVSAASTYYDTFYKKNKIEINTGSDWFRRTGLDFNKENKSSYSFIRPKYEYDYLSVEKNINNEKNKFIQEKRNEEERIKAMKEFAFKKSFYNSNINKNNEMKDMLNLYKFIVENKKKEEEERKKKEEEDKKKEKEDEIRRQKEEEERRKKEEEEKKRKEEEEKRKNYESSSEEENENEKEKEEIKEEEKSIHFSEEEIKEPKPKINLNDIKYIGPSINNNNNVKVRKATTFNNMGRNEIIININMKINPVQLKKKTIDSKIKYKIEKDKELNETEDNNYSYNNTNSNKKKEFPLQSDILSYRDYTDRTSYLRKINTKLNNVNQVDVAKDSYIHHFTPLSFFDNKHKLIKKQNKKNESSDQEESFMFKTFSNFKDDYLSMRRTLSSYHEEQMRNSKLYSRGGKKMRIQLKELVSTPRDNINYPIIYLPVPGSNLLTSIDK